MHQYTHLDLLAPMPDVEVDKQRVLIVEGSLKYRDHSNARVSELVTYYIYMYMYMHSHACIYLI